MNNIIHLLKHKKLLEMLLADPSKEYSIRSIAILSGTPYATTWRVIRSLEKAGAVTSRKLGSACIVVPDLSAEEWNELKRFINIETEPLIVLLKNEFEFIRCEVEGVILYGSKAKGSADERSDVDICIVRPQNRNVLGRIYSKLGDKYDIKIFEDLPLYLKLDVIGNYKVILGSEPDISYYFYGFRKLGQDMRNRMLANRFNSVREMVRARKRWLDARR